MEQSTKHGDNTQERFYIWLACAIESEGNFSMAWTVRKHATQLYPRVQLSNNDLDYINYASNCNHGYIQKDCDNYRLIWVGFKRVKTLIDKIKPYLVTNRKQNLANILLTFIDYRLSLDKPKTPYGKYEEQLFLNARKLNNCVNKLPKGFLQRFKKSSETNTLNTKSEDRVRPSTKLEEINRND